MVGSLLMFAIRTQAEEGGVWKGYFRILYPSLSGIGGADKREENGNTVTDTTRVPTVSANIPAAT